MLTARAITFRDEGEFEGEPIGSVTVTTTDDRELYVGWTTLSIARRLALQYKLVLEEA
jgi:hypothetical protein